MRGNLLRYTPVLGGSGSIPACAGEPEQGYIPEEAQRVYPRVCGGTRTDSQEEARDQGLSPRVRGNPLVIGCPQSMNRSIPACAGEPPEGADLEDQERVYPRVCGGTPGGVSKMGECTGLSPRVRGNPLAGRMRTQPAWSIPACAGEPLQYWRIQTW